MSPPCRPCDATPTEGGAGFRPAALAEQIRKVNVGRSVSTPPGNVPEQLRRPVLARSRDLAYLQGNSSGHAACG